jgi:hypothetical protein
VGVAERERKREREREREGEAMEGDEHELLLACVISGTLFAVLGSGSFSILWAVNWRPWRIYR